MEAIKIAIKNPNIGIEVIKLLIDYGANINSRTFNSTTALSYACKYNINNNVIEILLKKGADPNLACYFGDTPLMHILHLAENDVAIKATTLLLSYGADPDLKNNNNVNSLMLAANRCSETSKTKILQIILNNRIDTYFKNKETVTKTILNIKDSTNVDIVIELILEYWEVVLRQKFLLKKTLSNVTKVSKEFSLHPNSLTVKLVSMTCQSSQTSFEIAKEMYPTLISYFGIYD